MGTFLGILIYTLKQLLMGLCLGELFARKRLFPNTGKVMTVMIGIASAPLFSGLLNYLIGLVCVGWNSAIWIIVPICACAVWLAYFSEFRVTKTALAGGLSEFVRQVKANIFVYAVGAGMAGFLAILIRNIFSEPHSYHYEPDYIITKIDGFIQNALGEWALAYRAVFHILLLIAVAALCGAFLRYLYRAHRRGRQSIKALMVGAFLTAVFLELILGCSLLKRPMFDSDRSHYELEARYFAEDTNSYEIDNYRGDKLGSAMKDNHGPVYIPTVADAYMIAAMLPSADVLIIKNYAYFCMYFGCMTLLFILARSTGNSPYVGMLSVVLFCFYENQNEMLIGIRDSFRFIALLLLLLFTWEVSTEIIDRGMTRRYGLFTALLTALALSAHASNAFVVTGMYVGVIVVLLLMKARIRDIIGYGACAFVGALVGGFKAIITYIRTGRFDIISGDVFTGTTVMENKTAAQVNKAARYTWDGILSSYSVRILAVIAIGVAGLLIMGIGAARFKDRRKAVWVAMGAGMLLPVTGAFDIIWHHCRQYLIGQSRYRMYFLLLLSIFGAWLIARALRKRRRKYWVKFTLMVLIIGVLAFSEYLSYATYNYWGMRDENVAACRNLGHVANERTDGDVFTYCQEMLYYTEGHPRLLYNMYSAPLIRASSDEEIEAAMEELNVGAIVLPSSGEYSFNFSVLPFWKYINEKFIAKQYERRTSLLPQEMTVYYNPRLFIEDDTAADNHPSQLMRNDTMAFGARREVSLPFTAPEDGFIHIRSIPTSTTDTWSIFTIDGNTTPGCITHTWNGGYDTNDVIIKKGEILDLHPNSCDRSLVNEIIMFVPLNSEPAG